MLDLLGTLAPLLGMVFWLGITLIVWGSILRLTYQSVAILFEE